MFKIISKLKSKLVWKILTIYIGVIFIPSLAIGANYYIEMETYILNEKRDLIQRTLDQYCSDIDMALESTENVYFQIQQNTNFIRFLLGQNLSAASQVSMYVSEFNTMFSYCFFSSRFIEEVTVYMTNDSLLEMGDHLRKLDKLQDDSDLEAKSNTGFWRYAIDTKQVIYRKSIMSPNGKNILGILEVKCNDEIIRESLNKLVSDQRNITLIYDDFHYDLEEDDSEPFEAAIEVYSEVLRIPMEIKLRTDSSSANNNIIYSLWMTFFCFILLSLILFFVLYQLSRRITKFSQSLNNNLNNYPKVYVDKKHDELSMLINNYNNMVNNNNYLLNQVKIEKLHQQEMEYKALQSQIDPHFIYNSLEGIRMMAEMRDESDISDAIFSLSKLMRYAFSISEKEVTLAQELEYIKQYINLQRLRFGNRLELNILCDKMGDIKCPRFSIQPMIENSVKYGFGKGSSIVNIWIEAEFINNIVHIKITNSGQEIPMDKLCGMNMALSKGESLKEYSSGSGIGLENVNNRMRFLYGHTFSMKLTNTGHGVSVDLHWKPQDFIGEIIKEEIE